MDKTLLGQFVALAERDLSNEQQFWSTDTLSVLQTLKEQMQTISQYVIVRTQSAGVFAGELEARTGQEVTLTNARRLWYWAGAASLSQMALTGTSRPNDCKFPAPVQRVLLLQAIEILDTTDAARKSIEEVPVWQS